MVRKPLLERAMELAYCGEFPRNHLIGRQLSREGYDNAQQHLDSASVKKMLNAERKRGDVHRATEPPKSHAQAAAENRA